MTASRMTTTRALWDAAFAAFRVAIDATKVGDIPGGGFDVAGRMFDDFERITAHLKANAPAHLPPASGGKVPPDVRNSGGSDETV